MEGTYTTSDELALLEAGADTDASADTREVLNYISALMHSVHLMAELPVCHRLIRKLTKAFERFAAGKEVGTSGRANTNATRTG